MRHCDEPAEPVDVSLLDLSCLTESLPVALPLDTQPDTQPNQPKHDPLPPIQPATVTTLVTVPDLAQVAEQNVRPEFAQEVEPAVPIPEPDAQVDEQVEEVVPRGINAGRVQPQDLWFNVTVLLIGIIVSWAARDLMNLIQGVHSAPLAEDHL